MVNGLVNKWVAITKFPIFVHKIKIISERCEGTKNQYFIL